MVDNNFFCNFLFLKFVIAQFLVERNSSEASESSEGFYLVCFLGDKTFT